MILVTQGVPVRIIEWFGLEGTHTDHLVHPPCHGQGHLSLDQVAQSAIQRDFEHFLMMRHPQFLRETCSSVLPPERKILNPNLSGN